MNRTDGVMKVGAKIVGWGSIKSRSDEAVMAALLKHGPLSVAFNVGPDTIYYDSGIINTDYCKKNTADDLDH